MTTMQRRLWSFVTGVLRNTRVAQLRRMSDQEPRWIAGPLTQTAFAMAVELFRDKPRKVGNTPYLSHLFAVSALVMEHGGSEVQTAAGLLHDVIEDMPVDAKELVRRLMAGGASEVDAAEVARIVEVSSDGKFGEPRDKRSWLPRKRGYLAKLTEKADDDPALLVSLADKVHNSEATLKQVREGTTATKLYKPFKAQAPEQKWYYSELAQIFSKKLGGNAEARPLVERLRGAVDEIFRDVEDWQS
jgi:(p)ppGpp synthase/HD superfamily hydrolase